MKAPDMHAAPAFLQPLSQAVPCQAVRRRTAANDAHDAECVVQMQAMAAEIAQLKRTLADLALDNALLREIIQRKL